MKKLEKLAAEKGKPLDRIIPPLVNRFGVVLTAEKLGYAASTISKWLQDNNYESMTIWQKKVTPQEAADIQRAHDEVNAWREEQGLPSIEQEVESWTS